MSDFATEAKRPMDERSFEALFDMCMARCHDLHMAINDLDQKTQPVQRNLAIPSDKASNLQPVEVGPSFDHQVGEAMCRLYSDLAQISDRLRTIVEVIRV